MLMAPFDRPSKVLPTFPVQPLNQPNTADQAAFTVLDGNGDGVISKDEWQRAGWTADRFKSFDTNGDGKVTQDEFMQARGYEREFQGMDANHDGSLDQKEFNGQGGWFGAIGGAVQAITNCFPIPGLSNKSGDRFKKFDKNGDGKVSESEYIAGRRAEDQSISVPFNPMPKPIWYA